jgi:hypothetical protein
MQRSILGLALALIIVLAFMGATPATAGMTVSATCTDGTISCTVGVGREDDMQGAVLQWRYLNVCDDPWRPVEMEPLPIPPFFEEHSLTFPAHDSDEWVEYAAFYVDADGSLHEAYGTPWGRSSDEVTCANPILVRGYLQGEPGVYIIGPCPETCWLWETLVVPFELEPGTWEYLVNSGIPVNIWGEYHVDEMPGATGVYATAVEPTAPGEDCAAAIATEPVTWGAVKSLYK